MAERVDQLIPYGYAETWIGTFHAFGDHVLRESALEIGPQPGVPGPDAARADHLPARAALAAAPAALPAAGRSHPHLSALLSLVSRAKDEDVSPERYRDWAEEQTRPRDDATEDRDEAERHLELAAFYAAYQTLLAEAGAADFGDQISRALALLRDAPRDAGQAARPLPLRARGRVPGHEPRPAGAGAPARRRGPSQHHRGRRRRPGHLPLARRGRGQPPGLPAALPAGARGGPHREPPLDPGHPGRGQPPHLLQQPLPAGGHRRASTSACARRGARARPFATSTSTASPRRRTAWPRSSRSGSPVAIARATSPSWCGATPTPTPSCARSTSRGCRTGSRATAASTRAKKSGCSCRSCARWPRPTTPCPSSTSRAASSIAMPERDLMRLNRHAARKNRPLLEVLRGLPTDEELAGVGGATREAAARLVADLDAATEDVAAPAHGRGPVPLPPGLGPPGPPLARRPARRRRRGSRTSRASSRS